MKATMFHLSKGGVGKTTISVLYAWYQRKLRRRVLFVDFDLQCNSTKVLTSVDSELHPGFTPRLIGTILDFADAAFPSKLAAGEPGTFDILAAVEDIKFGAAEGEAIMASVRALLASDAYDIAIFDTSPVLDEQIAALLQTVGHIVLPVRPDDFSFDQIGVVLQLKTFADQNRAIPLNIAGILINGMMAKPTMQNAVKLIRRGYGEHTIASAIDVSEPIRQSIETATPIFSMANSWARSKRKELEAAFEEIEARSA